MIMSIGYILIPENELDLLTKTKKTQLTKREWEILIEYWDEFKKFLEKSKFSFQIKLSQWIARWNEEKIWNAIETCDEIIKSLKNIPDVMEKFNIENEKKLQNPKK